MTFKVCSMCKKHWEDRDDCLRDPEVKLAGYQVDFTDLDQGYFLFNHSAADCGTSIAVLVGDMMDLRGGLVHQESMYETAACEGHCLVVTSFEKCRAPCRNARVRDVMRAILELNRGPLR